MAVLIMRGTPQARPVADGATRRARAGRPRLHALLALAWTAAVALFTPAQAQAPVINEYQVEAVFLFNFAQFVTWPDDAFAGPADPLVVCVLGIDPFGSYLDATLRGENVEGRPLALRRYAHADDLGPCHILFISRSEADEIAAILARVRGRSTLTVSDADDFGRRGGMVRFFVDNQHVRVRINVEAARAARLAISSKLLRIAEIVSTEAGR